MQYATKSVLCLLVLGLSMDFAQAASLCKPDIVGISMVEGTYDPPGYMPPDEEKYRGNKMPQDIIVQRWNNLRAANHPLVLVCRYKGRPDEAFNLPDDTNSCELTYKRGLIFECRF